MKLTGLHFLLTYQCPFECDHCFVWGSPWQSGVMTLADIRNFLQQARDTGNNILITCPLPTSIFLYTGGVCLKHG